MIGEAILKKVDYSFKKVGLYWADSAGVSTTNSEIFLGPILEIYENQLWPKHRKS